MCVCVCACTLEEAGPTEKTWVCVCVGAKSTVRKGQSGGLEEASQARELDVEMEGSVGTARSLCTTW